MKIGIVRLGVIAASCLICCCLVTVRASAAEPRSEQDVKTERPPQSGDQAKDFELESLRGGRVKLSQLTKEGPVVLVVLRGYPGYQCPICSRQVGDFLEHADEFASANVRVLMVYPGPSAQLKQRAEEFFEDETIPGHFHLVIDPGYKFTNLYNLRWDAPRETAYPSTFIIDQERVIRSAQVSKVHGGRTKAKKVLENLAQLGR